MLRRLVEAIDRTPVLAGLAHAARIRWYRWTFRGSQAYWESRYRGGGTSGGGSAGRLAGFKAEVVNALVCEHKIASVVEFGSGDGNQLVLADYPRYIGLDVARAAIQRCSGRFAGDRTKSFFLYDPFCFLDHERVFHADLALSLDVIFHLIEDAAFEAYMRHLFAAADRFVVIYSPDSEGSTVHCAPYPHMRLRAFTPWVRANCPAWTLVRRIPNRYPYDAENPAGTSMADFFNFQKGAAR